MASSVIKETETVSIREKTSVHTVTSVDQGTKTSEEAPTETQPTKTQPTETQSKAQCDEPEAAETFWTFWPSWFRFHSGLHCPSLPTT